MKAIALASAAVCAVMIAGSAHASTSTFLFSGTIVGESVTGVVDPEPQDPDLLGRAFSAKFVFSDSMGVLTAETFLTVDISGHPGYLTGPEDPGGPEPKTYTATGLPVLTFGPGAEIQGSAAAVGGYSISFDYFKGASTAALTADFALNSVSRADDPGGLTLNLGATRVTYVPLPSSAPMFGAGLIAVGAAGYVAKRRKATASA